MATACLQNFWGSGKISFNLFLPYTSLNLLNLTNFYPLNSATVELKTNQSCARAPK